MRERYGFGLSPEPPWREARRGRWRVSRHLPSLADGYASPPGLEAERFVLSHRRRFRRVAWMSTGLFERESHAPHVHAANGLVVAAGLGLGLFAYAAASKREVTRLVVVERDRNVIALMAEASGLADWPDREKMTIVEADALDPDLARVLADATAGRRPDYLFADIWPRCASEEAPAQTAAMARALRPAAAGWWGQELSFVLWARARAVAVTTDELARWADAIKVPIPIGAGYAQFCRDVAATLAPRASPWRVLDWWRRRLRRSR